MKIISWNVNGIRAANEKGFFNWFKGQNADIVGLQEIKAQVEQFPVELIKPENYFSFINPSKVKKGHSGTTVYTKTKPSKIQDFLGMKEFDDEGRVLKLDYPEFSLINFYIPYGGRDKENLVYKLKVYDYLIKYLDKAKDKNIILMGDFNIAHTEIDLANPKANKNNIMFTVPEREKIQKIIDLEYIDTFREFNKQGGNYTWWSYMLNARDRNIGWRIDYIFVSKSLKAKLKNAFILKDVLGSDHCPVGIEISL